MFANTFCGFRKKWLILTISCLSALVGEAAEYSRGATDKEIKIGKTVEKESYFNIYNYQTKITQAANAYIQMLNEKGGVNGRKIVVITKETDQQNPEMTAMHDLVGDKGVLLLFNCYGKTDLRPLEYLANQKIPNLFVLTAIPGYSDPKKFPWSLSYYPSDIAKEAQAAGSYVVKTWPDAKVGTISTETVTAGLAYIKNFKKALGPSLEKMFVKSVFTNRIDTDVGLQIEVLKESGADTVYATSGFAPTQIAQTLQKLEELKWQPRLVLSLTAGGIMPNLKDKDKEIMKGTMTIGCYKDPLDPKWKEDPNVKAYREFAEKYLPKENAQDIWTIDGYTRGQLLEIVLKRAGDVLTHENILKQATNLSLTSTELFMLLPGIEYRTTPTDYSGIQELQMRRFTGTYFESIGEPISVKNIEPAK